MFPEALDGSFGEHFVVERRKRRELTCSLNTVLKDKVRFAVEDHNMGIQYFLRSVDAARHFG